MSPMRVGLVEHVLRARPAALEGARSGELATAAVQGVDALEAYFGGTCPQLALSVLVPVAILASVVPMDRTSAAIIAVTLPLIPLFMVLVGRAAQASARSRLGALQALGGRFLDVVRGLPTLRAHGRARPSRRRWRETGDRFRRETMATLRVAFLSALVLELAATLGVALVAVDDRRPAGRRWDGAAGGARRADPRAGALRAPAPARRAVPRQRRRAGGGRAGARGPRPAGAGGGDGRVPAACPTPRRRPCGSRA